MTKLASLEYAWQHEARRLYDRLQSFFYMYDVIRYVRQARPHSEQDSRWTGDSAEPHV